MSPAAVAALAEKLADAGVTWTPSRRRARRPARTLAEIARRAMNKRQRADERARQIAAAEERRLRQPRSPRSF